MATTRPATIKDVAQVSGVSTATVSYVLNNGPRHVNPATKARVVAAMKRLQYHPNSNARALNHKRLNCIGVVFPQPNPSLVGDSYFGALLDGIINTATERRQNVTLYTGVEWRGRESLPAFRDRRVDGLLLIATLTDSDIVSSLTEARIPFVLINDTLSDPRVASVDIDNADAVSDVIRHLVALGHCRIALLGGQANSPSTLPRLEGYRRAMAEHGLSVEPDLMIHGEYTREWGYKGMRHLLALPDPPTAVFAGGDGIALGVYQACREYGLSIPGQMSVVGFDDAPFASQLDPPLTTVRHPLLQIGRMAAMALLDFLDDDVDGASKISQIILPAELIVRESTAGPRTPLTAD